MPAAIPLSPSRMRSKTSELEDVVLPSKIGEGIQTSSQPRLAKTFWETFVKLWPVTSASVKVESTSGLPNSV